MNTLKLANQVEGVELLQQADQGVTWAHAATRKSIRYKRTKAIATTHIKNDRFGILLIVSAVLMIALVVGLILQHQQAKYAAQIRMQGLAFARSMSAFPFAMLAPKPGEPGVLHSLLAYYANPAFGYATVTAPDGTPLAQVTSPGALVPTKALPTATASVFGERMLESPHEARKIREFYGPVMDGGNLKAYVRVGFFEPSQSLAVEELPFFASLALAMFLLVPLIHFIVKREMAPLGALDSQLQAMAEEAHVNPPVASSDVRRLADTCHRYLADAAARIRELEQDRVSTLASGRLLEYGSNKLNAVLQCLPDGLLILDPSGEVTFASSKIEPLLGVDINEVLSNAIDVWCKDAELRMLLSRYRRDSSETGRQLTIEFTPTDVPDKHLWATAQPLVGGVNSMAFGTLIVLRDATREHLGQQAGHDFVAHVSHELKSPLNVIAMYSEMLQGARVGDEQLRVEAANVIQDEVERMNLLVGNLLNVIKLEMGSMSPECNRVKLDDLLRDALNHALPLAESKSMRLDIQVPRDLTAVSIDKDLFRIALNNLLSNAIKYSEAGGAVSLIAEEDDHDIVITVRDSGIGIAQADQARVFEKFYRVSEGEVNKRGGHGLGLYLVRQIVELHHGRLTLQSEPGRGSAFSIHLKKMPALVQGTNIL